MKIRRYLYILLATVIASPMFSGPLVASNQNLELKGTIFTKSLKPPAIIKNIETGKINMYESGENIGKIEILDINRAEVILREGKSRYVLTLPGGAVKQPKLINIDIVKRGETFYISREEVNKAISKIPQIMHDVKIMPHFSKGMPQGIRLSNVKKGSIFQKAGVESGDILKSVNGMSLKTPYHIFKAYKELKRENALTVDIVRNGEATVLNYAISGGKI